ncbi:MAG TPA: GNAT family N-acetyltransferase [Steroidobacteraceae bacterium]|nr:GNAT family N-acetyltransferase [Steroidobacteraceae bacterium]
MVAVRPAVPADAADNSREDMDLHCAQNFSAEIQGREIAEPRLLTFLAEVDGALTGFAQLRLTQPSSCVAGTRPAELQRIYVSSEWHGRGIARSLMREVIEVVGVHSFMPGRDRQRDLVLAAPVDELLSVTRQTDAAVVRSGFSRW